ncbi:MAG: hypothetical protein ACPHO8_17430 [Mariniblastus sp.]
MFPKAPLKMRLRIGVLDWIASEFDNPIGLGDNPVEVETSEEHLFLWPRKIAGSNEFLGDVIKD